jgi:hypothetical protein
MAPGSGSPDRRPALGRSRPETSELVPAAQRSFWDLRAPTSPSPSPSPSPTTPTSSAHAHVNVERHSLSSVQPGKNLGRVVLARGPALRGRRAPARWVAARDLSRESHGNLAALTATRKGRARDYSSFFPPRFAEGKSGWVRRRRRSGWSAAIRSRLRRSEVALASRRHGDWNHATASSSGATPSTGTAGAVGGTRLPAGSWAGAASGAWSSTSSPA